MISVQVDYHLMSEETFSELDFIEARLWQWKEKNKSYLSETDYFDDKGNLDNKLGDIRYFDVHPAKPSLDMENAPFVVTYKSKGRK